MKKFNYFWKNKEANFGKPVRKQVKGGTHVTFEIVPRYKGKTIALRRKSIPGHEPPPGIENHPEGMLFFCHNLIRYAESMDSFVKRVVKYQAGIGIKSWKIVKFESFYQEKDDHWSLLGYILAELTRVPKTGNYGNKVTEVVAFTKNNIPRDFAWWTKEELKDFLRSL